MSHGAVIALLGERRETITLPLRGQLVWFTRNPVNASGRVLMGELDTIWRVNRPEAQRILNEYTSAAGFNHVAAGPAVRRGYNGVYPDTDWLSNPDGFADYLDWLHDNGVEFTLFLLPDIAPYWLGTSTGWDLSLVYHRLSPFYAHPRIVAATTRTANGWEMYAPIPMMRTVFAWMARLFPNAERLLHNAVGRMSPALSTEPEEDAYRAIIEAGCTGLLWQGRPPIDPVNDPPEAESGRTALEQLRYDLWDNARRFGLITPSTSPWGVPVVRPDGTKITLDYFECLANPMMNREGYHSLGPTYGAAALSIEGVRYALDGAPAL